MRKIISTILLTTLLASCTNSGMGRPPGQHMNITADTRTFAAHVETAMRQLAGDPDANVIPPEKKAHILRLAQQVKTTTGVELERMYPIEQSPVIELSELGKSARARKGLFIWGATTNPEKHQFDWTAMALVDLETFDVMDLKINASVGKTARNWSVGDGPFLLMNDYSQAASNSKNREAFSPTRVPRRVLPDGRPFPLQDPDTALLVEFFNGRTNKTHVIDGHFDVYEALPDGAAVRLVKVGNLRP